MRPANLPKTDHFEQQFQESQAYLQENYLQPGNMSQMGPGVMAGGEHPVGAYNVNDQMPIQLVKFKQNGQIEVNDSALDLISMYNKPIGFVCLAGKYRTGKSFLLNKLLDLRGNGFRVDPSTTACTEGIWMWSKPLYNTKQDCYLFFLDTQGSDSTNRDSSHDAKLFTLAILISSYFIFNSVGAIDQMSINQLNLVTTLSKNIAVGDGNQQALYHYMPKFMWLLRDFVLEIMDQRGKKLTPNEYLENCLLEQNAQIRTSESARSVRRALLSMFRDRECLMLVRPALEQSDLKNLATLPNNKLRREFLDGVNQLKQKIFNNAAPKTIGGQPVNSLVFTELLEHYVDVINNNGIPNITSAWEQVTEQAGAEAYNAAIQTYNNLYSQYFAVDQPKGEEIHSILKEMHDKAIDAFDADLESPNDRYRNKLKNFLFEKQGSIIKINDEFNAVRNVELLREFSAILMKNVQIGRYSAQNSKVLTADLNEMISRYNQTAKGPKKCEVLAEFLLNFNPVLINSYTVNTSARMAANDKTGVLRDANMQKQATIRMLEQRLQSTMAQTSAAMNSNAMKNAEQKKRVEADNQKLKRQIEQMLADAQKQKDKKKCCAIF